jgi:hypothetical protein
MPESLSKQAVRFICKILLIASVLLICDQGIGRVLKFFYARQESGDGYRTTYAVDSTSADILVFGSSRASHSYVPEVFETRSGYSFYNTGRDGSFLLYNYAVFMAITNRYNPKLIIIDINPGELEYLAFEYDRLSSLLPYYQTHPELRHIVDLRGPFERIKRVSTIYPYNSLVLQIGMGNLEFNKKRVPNTKGYIPFFKTMNNDGIDTVQIIACTTDENKILALKDVIISCNQKNISLFFVYSPIWEVNKENCYTNILSKLCSENGISFIDMSNDQAFIDNPEYFSDNLHLNDAGARTFSAMLSDKIW